MKPILSVSICLLIFLFNQVCSAISPANNDTIKEAQEYGKNFSNIAFSEFIRPWTIYEEKAAKLDIRSDHSFIYTPFSLIASDARIRQLSGKSISIDNGREVIDQYNGYLTFYVILYASEPNFTQSVKATLISSGNIVTPSTSPKFEIEKTPWYPEKPKYMATMYLYFPLDSILLDFPAVLSITTEDGHNYKFYYNLPLIK